MAIHEPEDLAMGCQTVLLLLPFWAVGWVISKLVPERHLALVLTPIWAVMGIAVAYYLFGLRGLLLIVTAVAVVGLGTVAMVWLGDAGASPWIAIGTLLTTLCAVIGVVAFAIFGSGGLIVPVVMAGAIACGFVAIWIHNASVDVRRQSELQEPESVPGEIGSPTVQQRHRADGER